MRRLAIGVIACGCGPADLFIEREWPADHTAIAAIANEGGAPLGEPRLLFRDSLWQFELETSEPFRIHVLSYAPPPAHPDLSQCRVAYGGDGDPVPIPDLSLATELLEGGGMAAFSESPPPAFEIRLEGCVPVEPCPAIPAEQVPAPPVGRSLTRVVAVSGERVFFAGGVRDDLDRRITIGRVDGDSVTILPPVAALVERIRELTWDGATSIYGLTEDGTMFLLQTDTSSVTPLGRPTPKIVDLSAAYDGTLIARDELGRVHRFEGGSAIPTLDESATFASVHIAAVHRDRIASTTPTGAIWFFDGTSWQEEQEGFTGRIKDLAGDELAFAAAGDFGPFLLRERDSITWRKIDRPFDDAPEAIAATGTGELVAVGKAGSGAVWSKERWCPFETGSERELFGVHVAPGGTIAYAVGEAEPGAPAVIVRIELPQR